MRQPDQIPLLARAAEQVAPGAYFVLTRRIGAPVWSCVTVIDDFSIADALSDRLRKPVPRMAARESQVVHRSALSPDEIARYTQEATRRADS